MLETKTYPNGLTLVVDNMAGYESVAFNMFVKVGSINEAPNEYGISHFIEHTLFKGTKKRSAYQISKLFDDLGANINAYTSFEETDFYFKCASADVEPCTEAISDMLFNATFDITELERERLVVMEEIKMYNDDPQSKVEYLANSKFYAGTPYCRDVGGTISNVKSLTRQKILNYKNKYYVPQNIILSFAGKITLKTAEMLVDKYFMPNFNNQNNLKTQPQLCKVVPSQNYAKSFKDNEQSQVCVTFPGLYYSSGDIYVAKIFDVAFGAGMSSVLYQTIRETLGLVYTISSSTAFNYAGGDMTIYFATSNKNVKKALQAVAKEILNIKKFGITKEQFDSAKNNLINKIKMSFESTSYVSLFNAKNISKFGKQITKQQYVSQFEAVTYNDMINYTKTLFPKNCYAVSVVGKNKNLELKKCFCL